MASRTRSVGSKTLPLPIAKRQRGCWCRCVPHGGKPKSAISSSPPCPKCLPPLSLCLASKWDVAAGGGGGMLHGIVVAMHARGFEVYDLAGTSAFKSTCAKIRARGVAATLHTSAPHCSQKNCLYIAVRVLLWHLQHPTTEWAKTPLLNNLPR